MGTRNLTMVIRNAEIKVAQYGQWDGYPDGQGLTALNFLRSVNLDAFKETLNHVKFIDDQKQAEIDAFYLEIGVTGDWCNMEQSSRIKARYPLFSRDNGAKILQMIMECDENPIYLYDQSSFAADSLMCEWAYVIDFDKGTLEVYTGFNKEPLTESDRFFNLKGEDGYEPIKILKSFSLDALPDKATFLKELEPVELDDENT